MASKLIGNVYMSDYRDYASAARFKAANECGHYPRMTGSGSPCAFCIDRLIERAMEESVRRYLSPDVA